MKKKLDIRPDTSVYSTYRRLSYVPSTALAEFLDNSTQSFFDNKDQLSTKVHKAKLEIRIDYNETSDTITIKDNAYGMDYENFTRAIILDRPPKNVSPNSRNEYGMGLKTAACWFGRYWSVESSQYGNPYKYKAEIDIDELSKYKNKEIEIDEDDCEKDSHYTIITIKKLNQRIKGKKSEKKIFDLLSSTYREDLRTGDIEIYYNGIKLAFQEVTPYVDENGKIWKDDISFTIDHNGTELNVTGYIAIRIPGSLEHAGFTLLRRNRVIIGGPNRNYRHKDIVGNQNSFEYQRLYGELKMDNWPVTQAKDNFDWETEDLEERFREKLAEIVKSKGYRAKAESIKVREKTNIKEVGKALAGTIPQNDHISEVTVEIASPVNHTTINVDDSFTLESEDANTEGSTGIGVDIEDNQDLLIKFKHDNVPYVFRIIYDDEDHPTGWAKFDSSEVSPEKSITIFTQHPFFYPFINKKDFLVVLAKFAVALFMAEIESYDTATDGMIVPSVIRLEMGKILEELTVEDKK